MPLRSRTRVALVVVSVLLAAAMLLPARSVAAASPPWLGSFYDVTDVSVKWSATMTDHVCFTGECVDLSRGSETDTFSATWLLEGADQILLNTANAGVDVHESRCADRAGMTTVAQLVGGTLSLGDVAGTAQSHLQAGWRCPDIAETMATATGVASGALDVVSDLPAPGIGSRSIGVAYSGSRQLQTITDATTTTIDLRWDVSAHYTTRCTGIAVQQNSALPVRFAPAWGTAPFCLSLARSGLPTRTIGTCEQRVVRLGSFACGAGPQRKVRHVRVCNLLPVADQRRLLGAAFRHSDHPEGFCGFGGRAGMLLVYRYSDPSWPRVFAAEASYAKLLAGIGRARFTTFTTTGGGKGLVVRGSRPWEAWAFGQKHGEVIYLTAAPGNRFLTRLGPRLDTTLRTILAHF